ncbi:MAG TPA: DUF89 family protein [Candidatus Marinimicrobia bacterium]|nr:DUF89 family protein [Candidatus Neomarinimicrobiota bacterium]
MKTYLDCFPCFVNQALRIGRMVTDDGAVIKQLIDEVGVMLKDIPLTSIPPETGEIIFKRVREISGIHDPLAEIKNHSTREVLEIYPRLKRMVLDSADPLLTAVRLAIAGNVIDFGIHDDYDIEKEIRETLVKEFYICDIFPLRRALDNAKNILFIGDNAGESVFDRLLIETMGKPTIYVVRAEPVLNDVTYVDAVAAGIGQVADITSSGSAAPGTILRSCSVKFRQLFKSADLVIAKGQGNYEGLSEEERPVFFLLKAKCPVIARDIGVETGAIVLKRSDV